jgi:Holliday junction resolvase RusA-like endonuclease
MRLYSPETHGYERILNIDLDVNPMGKPRMTRRDRWKKRPVILRWFAYKDEILLKSAGFIMPLAEYWIIFTIRPAASWSIARSVDAYGTGHQQKPDKDNLEKGILDIFMDDDSKVYDGRASKQWGVRQNIEIWLKDGTR